MHISPTQRQFLDGVQEALRRYDAPLKDINHKARVPSIDELVYSD
jgi:hypothetical protein